MKAHHRNVLAVAVLSAAMPLTAARPEAGADHPAVLAADQNFVQATAKSDGAALGKLLDSDFVWIDASGRLKRRAQVLGSVPKSRLSEASGADVQRHDYGQIETVEANSGKMHVLRVWVKR